jgi:hypothetical protein
MVNRKITVSKRVNELPGQAPLLYTWIIPHLDVNGCFWGSASMVKSLIFPRRNDTVEEIEAYLQAMEQSKDENNVSLIIRYKVNNDIYLHMPGFESEQVGLRKDREEPEYPPYLATKPTKSRKVAGKLPEKIPQKRREEKLTVREVKLSEEKAADASPQLIFGEFKNVRLSQDEHAKLVERLGETSVTALIERLSCYMPSKGKTYRNHYATLLNWSRNGNNGGNQVKGGTASGFSNRCPKQYTTKPDD